MSKFELDYELMSVAVACEYDSMVLTWLIENGYISDSVLREASKEVRALRYDEESLEYDDMYLSIFKEVEGIKPIYMELEGRF